MMHCAIYAFIIFPPDLNIKRKKKKKRKNNLISETHRQEGVWGLSNYLSTAERTSSLSIFPPSPDARSNAPALDMAFPLFPHNFSTFQ